MIVHQVASGLDSHGGPSYTVPALCRALSGHDVKIVLHALLPSAVDSGGEYEFHAYERSSLIPKLGVSRSMRRALSDAVVGADIIHSHMLWMMPNIYPALVLRQRRTRCRLVMSPRGTLDPWDFNNHKLQKRIAWYAGQRYNLAHSAVLHATAPMERDHFRALGLRAPIAVIANGVEIPDLSLFPRTTSSRRRLLFLARINPKKGVDILLRAWRNVQDGAKDWDLIIAGDPGGNHLEEMRALAAELGVQRVAFDCPVSAERKWALYRNADLYVLPTRGDNWAVSISDALSFAVPAIVSKEAPWSGLCEHGCGWWIDLSVEALSECFREALQKDAGELAAMGGRGREWMAREFSWNSVGLKMKETYRWIAQGGGKPEWVFL